MRRTWSTLAIIFLLLINAQYVLMVVLIVKELQKDVLHVIQDHILWKQESVNFVQKLTNVKNVMVQNLIQHAQNVIIFTILIT